MGETCKECGMKNLSDIHFECGSWMNGKNFMQSPACRQLAAKTAECERLRELLGHMSWCRKCAEGSWKNCEEGKEALAALFRAGGKG